MSIRSTITHWRTTEGGEVISQEIGCQRYYDSSIVHWGTTDRKRTSRRNCCGVMKSRTKRVCYGGAKALCTVTWRMGSYAVQNGATTCKLFVARPLSRKRRDEHHNVDG